MRVTNRIATALILSLTFSFAFYPASVLAEQSFDFGSMNSLTAVDVPQIQPPQADLLPEQVVTTLLKDGTNPVIVTVPGISFGELGWGPLELKKLIALLKKLFPDSFLLHGPLTPNLPEQYLQDTDLEQAFENEMIAADNPGADINSEILTGVLTTHKPRLPVSYLEDRLENLAEYDPARVTVIPFHWSRDPADTHLVLPRFEKKLAYVYDSYKNSGRPIYILSHSWGSVLMHTTMHRLEKSRPDVKIAKFVTLGSPLVPNNPVLKIFIWLKVNRENLEKIVSKPANLGYWENIWAYRDLCSNSIPAADKNIQVDQNVEVLDPLLWDIIIHHPALRSQAQKDLIAFRNLSDWHYSYLFDFNASLKSINRDIFIPVFSPIVAPQVITR